MGGQDLDIVSIKGLFIKGLFRFYLAVFRNKLLFRHLSQKFSCYSFLFLSGNTQNQVLYQYFQLHFDEIVLTSHTVAAHCFGSDETIAIVYRV